MRFRLKAFALHLAASCAMLALVLGTLYLGWYHWPGWYLAHVGPVVGVMAGVDVVLGPLMTFIIANPAKPRRGLARDIAVIACVQVIALVYGTTQLWNGRPLYYAYSVNSMSIVQAYDLEPTSIETAREHNEPLAPHWHSLPRWIWAPLPDDSAQASRIMASATSGGFDVTAMPDHYKSWDAGLSDMRKQLKRVDDIKFFSADERRVLKERMKAAGLPSDQANGIALTGRTRPLLAVVDPASMKILALIKAT
jgi:hypothetical protein